MPYRIQMPQTAPPAPSAERHLPGGSRQDECQWAGTKEYAQHTGGGEERDGGKHGEAERSGDSAHARAAAGLVVMIHDRDDGVILRHDQLVMLLK
jgi:hypothetical protein